MAMRGGSMNNSEPMGKQGHSWTERMEGDLEVAEVGGKAAGLSRLQRAGFAIPRGFCVTTTAFEDLVVPMAIEVEELEELREAIEAMSLPDRLVAAIEARTETIGARRWAVRSSGIAEDTETRSYAGQALSVLDVEGVDGILEALRKVWAGHFSMERLLYLAQGGLEVTPAPTAVIIQEMLEPEVAGVLFSINPLTGDEGEAVVTSAEGLGEAVVTGIKGETHYLDKASGYLRREAGDDGESGRLNDERLRQLASCAREVEEALGGPRDIEWAYCPQEGMREGRLFLLQARPITTGRAGSPETVWTNANVGEALPGVATPMTWSIIRDFSRRGFEQAFGTLGLEVPEEANLVDAFRGRIYLNLTQFMSIASAQPLFRPERLFSIAGGGGVELVQDIYEQRSRKGFLKRLPVTIPRILGAQMSMPVVAPLWGKYFTKKVDAFFDRDLEGMRREELVEELAHLDQLFDRTGKVMLSTSANFLMSYVVTAECLRLVGGPEAARHEQALISGLDVKSAEPGLELLDLARQAKRSLRLRKLVTGHRPEEVLDALWAASEHEDVAAFMESLQKFQKAHGHRAPREAELATPRWREDTTFLFEVVRSLVEAQELPSTTEVARERSRKQESAQKLLERYAPGGINVVLKGLLTLTRANARRREYMRDRVVDSLDIYRRFFLECGRRLMRQRVLRRKEDVFFLNRKELESWLDHAPVAETFALRVLVRRALHDHFQAQQAPPDTFLLRGSETIAAGSARPPEPTPEPGGDGSSTVTLEGLAGSPGRVTGKARVIVDPNEGDTTIKPGEILVAPYTDVGWTPLFLTAAGVVMSLGGPLSHSCIVAREYGLPAVVNAKHAVEVIETGDRVTVDGDQGLVHIQKRPGSSRK